jgi:phosphatidylcholine synthase
MRKTLAWSVHLFTASGAAWGFLSLLAVFHHQWKSAFLWMTLSMVVDGLDGLLARKLDVKTYANGLDGALLDNILDYLNYVIVPALFLIEADILPAPFRLAGAISILLSSAYQFTQIDAKTEDHYFKGFPSYWNVVAIYMFVLGLPEYLNLALIALFNILVFVPTKWLYPTRDTRLTLWLTYFYGAIGTACVFLYPKAPLWVWWFTLTYAIYYIALSLWPRRKTA